MKYTKSEFADKKIEKDMELICEEIKKRVPNVISIILSGGFARGCGPVKIEGDEIFPYNDYDIQIISELKIDKDKIDNISSDISRKLGYKGIVNFYPFKKEEQKAKDNFYIDLKCDTPEDLKKFLPRIRNYELKNDSMILYGKDLRNLIPDYKLDEMPLSEGGKFLLDRMSQMIEYYSTVGKHDDDFLTYIIQQAYTACCTALLMLSKKYQVGYVKSMKILKETYKNDFPKLYEKIPDLHKKIEEYVNWKTNPKKPAIKDIHKEWFIAKDNIILVSMYFFGKFLEKDVTNVDQLSKAIMNMRKKFYLPYLKEILKSKRINLGNSSQFLLPMVSLVLKYKYYQRLKKFGVIKKRVLFEKSPDLIIFASLVHIADAIKEDHLNQNTLKKGQKMLGKVYPSKGKNWDDITIDYANAYISFFLQKI